MEWKSVTVPLTREVRIGDKVYKQIVLREPDVEALEKIEAAGIKLPDGGQTAADIDAGAEPPAETRLTVKEARAVMAALLDPDYPPEIVKRLHPVDFAEAGEQMAPLLLGDDPSSASRDSGPSPATGSSPT